MSFGIFIHRTDSVYDDSPAEKYHFPKIYLSRVQACVGRWIIYYEPTKVRASKGYYAIAKVQEIVPDRKAEKMFYAIIEPNTYLPFINAVPFKTDEGLVERGLLNNSGAVSGRSQAAVRSLNVEDFNRILELGFAETDIELPRIDEAATDLEVDGLSDNQAPFIFDQQRPIITQLTNRPFRDKMFRRSVLSAYQKRCAVTGLKLINGGGRAEVDAAHIKPVSANGPDIVTNGLALSGTAHWMFDRGLITLSNTFDILVSRHVNDPDSIKMLINKSGKALVPELQAMQPHPSFLTWHRENCFKQ